MGSKLDLYPKSLNGMNGGCVPETFSRVFFSFCKTSFLFIQFGKRSEEGFQTRSLCQKRSVCFFFFFCILSIVFVWLGWGVRNQGRRALMPILSAILGRRDKNSRQITKKLLLDPNSLQQQQQQAPLSACCSFTGSVICNRIN